MVDCLLPASRPYLLIRVIFSGRGWVATPSIFKCRSNNLSTNLWLFVGRVTRYMVFECLQQVRLTLSQYAAILSIEVPSNFGSYAEWLIFVAGMTSIGCVKAKACIPKNSLILWSEFFGNWKRCNSFSTSPTWLSSKIGEGFNFKPHGGRNLKHYSQNSIGFNCQLL